jgi:predicted N-formylglutamate amidohydrolase
MTEDSVFEILGEGATGSVFLTAEHAYPGVPFPLAASKEDDAWLQTHWGYDLGVRNVVRSWVDAASVTAVSSRVTRLVCDHNRAIGDPTWTRRHVEGHILSFNAGLEGNGEEELARRVQTLWAPYHAAITAQLNRHIAAGVRPYLLSVHSFTPALYGELREFDLGMLFSIYGDDARAFGDAASALGLRTRYNGPYSGRRDSIYSISRHGLRNRLPFLELELNQGLVGDPERAAEVGRLLAAAAETMLASRG